MKILRKMFLAWMFAWLPISGVMAATMPFCSQGIMGKAIAAQQHQAQAAQVNHITQASAEHCSGGKSTTSVCEHCDLCHIAGAMVPAALFMQSGSVENDSHVVPQVAHFSTLYPETPQHPPLSART